MRGQRPEYQQPSKPTPVPAVVVAFRPPAPSLPRTRAPVDLDDTLAEADAIFKESGHDKSAWNRAEPRHFVGVYFRFHASVHGIEPSELRDPRTFGLATVEAASLLSREFNGDKIAFAHFVSWVWLKEHRTASRGSTYRTGWRRQFSAALVTDYRVAMRQGGR